MRPDLPQSRGSALLLVLWSLILLSMSVFGVVEIVETSVDHASHLELASQARALALSGLAVGLNPDMQPDDSLLQKPDVDHQKWAVDLQGEAARLNLNHLLLTKHREVLVRLFVSWGVKPDPAQYAADCLYNWVAPELRRVYLDVAGQTGTAQVSAKPVLPEPTDGLVADYLKAKLTHLPTNQPFTSLDEAHYVLGMDAVEKARPNWQDSFTLWSDGPLDVNEASPELIAVLFNITLPQAQSFTTFRNGKDGLVGTADDVKLRDLAALKLRFGLGNDQATAIAPEVSFDDTTRRIQSRGVAGDVAVTVSVVARLKSSPPEYLLWHEL